VVDRLVPMAMCSTGVQLMEVWLRYVTGKHTADLSADKSADNSVWIRIGKLRIDRSYLTAMVDNRTLRSCVYLRYVDYVQPIRYLNRRVS
jgi:hypothetical protein